MQYRNPRFTAQGSIDVEINHPDFGWIVFTASPDDPEEPGRKIFEDLRGEAAPYMPPEEPTE